MIFRVRYRENEDMDASHEHPRSDAAGRDAWLAEELGLT